MKSEREESNRYNVGVYAKVKGVELEKKKTESEMPNQREKTDKSEETQTKSLPNSPGAKRPKKRSALLYP